MDEEEKRRKLRSQVRERGYEEIADLDDILWGALHKFAAGKVSETSQEGVWFLRREMGGSAYATWCQHCNRAAKVYQTFRHREGCRYRDGDDG